MHRKYHQRGIAIVELMIVVAISSFMLLAITSLFVGNSRTLKTQNAMSEMNDNGRYALNRIATEIRMLGYRDQDYLDGPLENALEATNGTTGATDVLEITYEANFDCNRTAVGASGYVTNVFEVINGALYCNNQLFVKGIENFQVMFGEDLDGDRVANRYVRPDSASLVMDQVVSIQLGIISVSSASGGAAGLGGTDTASTTGDIQDTATSADRIRRTYTITVALRNRI